MRLPCISIAAGARTLALVLVLVAPIPCHSGRCPGPCRPCVANAESAHNAFLYVCTEKTRVSTPVVACNRCSRWLYYRLPFANDPQPTNTMDPPDAGRYPELTPKNKKETKPFFVSCRHLRSRFLSPAARALAADPPWRPSTRRMMFLAPPTKGRTLRVQSHLCAPIRPQHHKKSTQTVTRCLRPTFSFRNLVAPLVNTVSLSRSPSLLLGLTYSPWGWLRTLRVLAMRQAVILA